jgi:hypothetical protein
MKLSLRTASNGNSAQSLTASNYEVFEREVSPDEAFAFLAKLVSPEDMIYLEKSGRSVDVWKYEESLWVEICSAQLWATSHVSEAEAVAIIDMLDSGHSFGNCIPITNREWDAYAPLGDMAASSG